MDKPDFNDALYKIESEPLSWKHIKVMLISGSSFFTDAYDLFVIGVVLLMIIPIFNLTPAESGIVASAALFGAVVGPLIFGYIGDRFGRVFSYWTTVLILVIGAIGSAFSFSAIELTIWRFILGIGIGGDYPLTSTIMAEYANRKDRGKLIASVFSMQGFGIMVGVGLAFLLLFLGISPEIAWRILVGAGAIPPILTLNARRKLYETPRFVLFKKGTEVDLSTRNLDYQKSDIGKETYTLLPINFTKSIGTKWKLLFGASIAWFLLDVSYYGTGIFTPYLASLFGFKGLYAAVEASAITVILTAVPGYLVAVALIDKQGRKSMQAIGFLVMSIAFGILYFFGNQILNFSPYVFFLIYGLTFFFTNYGPNTTTYVYPVELFPTPYRARAHGIASMSGKLGAAISVLLFPFLISYMGKFGVIGLLAFVALLGSIITFLLLPETKQKFLTETSGESELILITSTLSNEFTELSNHMIASSKTLRDELMNEKINSFELFQKIKLEEHNADQNVHKIMDYIANTKISSIMYLDISHLARRLDDIIDTIEAVAARFYIYDLSYADKFMKEFSNYIVQCTVLVDKSLSELKNLLAIKSVPERINALYKEATNIENLADDLLRTSLKELMKLKDAVTIIKLKEVYEDLEAVTDGCVDVLDIVSDIALRFMYEIKGLF